MGIRYNSRSGLPMINGGGEWRVLGALPSPKLTALPSFAEDFKAIPRSEWVECSLKEWGCPVLNQGKYGSCVGQGTETAFRYIWKISGQTDRDFSPTFIYGHINNNRDNGAQVSDGPTTLRLNGTCLLSQVGMDKIFKSQFPQEAFTTAKRFKLLSAYRCTNYDELCSALMLGFPVISGIAVGSNFTSIPRTGIAPIPDRVVGGHCMCHIGLKQIGGKWMIETQNSWSENWGMGGFCYLQEAAWHPRYGFGFDCWALTAVQDDPEDTRTDTPVVTATEKKDDNEESASVCD